jgi:hypothetical protein
LWLGYDSRWRHFDDDRVYCDTQDCKHRGVGIAFGQVLALVIG